MVGAAFVLPQDVAAAERAQPNVPFCLNLSAMNTHARRVLNAAAAGQRVMNDNSALWNTRPPIVSKKAALDNKIEEIEDLEDLITDSTGIATKKKAARIHAARLALKLVKPMKVFARDTDNEELEGEINLSWTKLRYRSDQVVIDNWQLVHDRAEDHGAELVAGGYTEAAWTTDLETAIEAFKDQRGRPKARRSDIKALNAQVALKVKELQQIKVDLLGLLAPYMEDEPLFYHTAESAFELDRTGVRHLALRLVFIDEATGVRLPKVEARIVELGLKRIASRNGRIDIPRALVGPGNYTLVFSLTGFVDQTVQNVGIADTFIKMEIVMVKEV